MRARLVGLFFVVGVNCHSHAVYAVRNFCHGYCRGSRPGSLFSEPTAGWTILRLALAWLGLALPTDLARR